MTQENMSVLTKKDFRQTFWRTMALQGCFNYERMQAIGFCYSMIPALKKLYGDDEEAMAEALERHLGFYNTSPQFTSFIVGTAIALEEQNTKTEDFNVSAINSMKTALMGPLAGIGDSFFWGTFRIIAAGVGTDLAIKGNLLGAILFILIYNVPNVILRVKGLEIGYKGGMNFIQKAYEQGTIEKITGAAKVLGNFVIGAMIATMVKLSISPNFNFGSDAINVQEILDGIMPQLLPLLLTFGVFALVKKGWKTTRIMLLLILGGIIGVYLGVF